MHSKTLSINTHHLVLMANVKDAPFKCSICKKVFISDNHLRRHEDRRHNFKTSPIPSQLVKEGSANETSNEPTIKAVLNATERIEDLLVKLAVTGSEKPFNSPLACSSLRNNFDDSLVTSSSFTAEKSEIHNENSECTSIHSMPNKEQKDNKSKLENETKSNFEDSVVTSCSSAAEKIEQKQEHPVRILNDSIPNEKQNMVGKLKYNKRSNFEDSVVTSCPITAEKREQQSLNDTIPVKNRKVITKLRGNDFLEEQENKAIWRLTSSVIKASDISRKVSIYYGNDCDSDNINISTPHEGNSVDGSPIFKSRSSLKGELLRKLDSKLESYGFDCCQNRLSEKDMKRIGHLLKEERDRIAEEVPDYHRLRQLIKDNAERRIEENLRIHSTYVS